MYMVLLVLIKMGQLNDSVPSLAEPLWSSHYHFYPLNFVCGKTDTGKCFTCHPLRVAAFHFGQTCLCFTTEDKTHWLYLPRGGLWVYWLSFEVKVLCAYLMVKNGQLFCF